MTTNRQNQHPAAIDAEKPTNLKTKTRRAAALLLMLALLAPLAAWAQNPDCNGPIAITADAPYFEGFESPTGTSIFDDGPLPGCWEAHSTGWTTPAPHNCNNANYAHSGSQSLAFYTANSSDYAVLPEFSNPISDLQISFWMRTNTDTDGQLQLGYITAEDDGTCNTFTPVATYANSVDYVMRTSDLPNVPVTAVRLVFKWENSFASVLRCFIDDMTVSINLALKPTELTCTEVTGTSATLTWTSYAESWQIMLNDDEDNLIMAETNPFTLTGLVSETLYTAKVRSYWDSDNQSEWSDAISFMPTNNHYIGSGDGTTNYLPLNNYYKYSLTQQIYTVEEMGVPGLIESISFFKNNGNPCNRDIDIYIVGTDKSEFESTSDWIAVTEADRMFSGMVSFASNDWTNITLDLGFVYDGTQNVAIIVDDNTGSYTSDTPFKAFAATTAQALYFNHDNINYDPTGTPGYGNATLELKNQMRLFKSELSDCMKTQGIVATEVGPDFAVIDWIEYGTSESWLVSYNGVTVEADEHPFTLTGLQPETEYTIAVSPTCDTIWNNTVTITTLETCRVPVVTLGTVTATTADLSWTTSFCEGYTVKYREKYPQIFGNTIMEEHFDGDGVPEGWYFHNFSSISQTNHAGMAPNEVKMDGEMTYDTFIQTPAIDLSGISHVHVFFGSSIETEGQPPIMTIQTSSDDGATWNDAWNESYEEGIWTINVTIATPDMGQSNVMFRINFNGADRNYIAFLDDIVMVGMPYGEWQDLPVIDTVATITGLNPNTMYDVKVVPDCDVNKESEMLIFTTANPCEAPTNLAVGNITTTTAEISWEGFSLTGYEVECAIPSGEPMTLTVEEGNTATLTGLAANTTYEVRVKANCYEAEYSQPVGFTTEPCEDMCALTFFVGGNGWEGNAIQVKDVLTGDIIATIANHWQTQTIALNVCDGRELEFSWVGVYFDSFVYYTVTDLNGEVIVEGNGLGFDTFNYTVSCTATDCRRPTAFAASEIGPCSVVLSWTENGPATEWEIAYKSVNDTVINYVTATTNPYTLTGLTPETRYAAQVTPVCEVDKPSKEIYWTTDVACPEPYDVDITPYPYTANVEWSGWGETYDIQWAEPVAPTSSAWLQYDNGTASRISISGTNQFTWGVMYPADSLHDNVLTKIVFYEFRDAFTDSIITLNVYSGGDTIPETLIGTETITINGTKGWHEVVLSTPIEFNPEQNLWITLTATGRPAVMAMSRQDAGINGRWFLNGSDWVDIATLFNPIVAPTTHPSIHCFAIRGFVETNDYSTWNWTTESGVASPFTITGLEAETGYAVKVKSSCGQDCESSWTWAYFTTLEGSIFTKDILAHTDNGGWYLIASPVAEAVTPTAQNGFLANEYDLYRFNQSAELEWENWKAEGEHYHFNLEAGRGYLYANSGDVTLTFVGTPHAATEPVEVALDHDPAADFAGWNLVGNPLPEIAFIDRDFYVMNGDHDEIVAAEGNTVELMEGIFVIAEGENDTMTFTPASQNAIANNASLVVSLSQGRGSVIDRAIVRFDSNRTLPKFQLNPNNTKVYIPQGGKDYAVVAAEQTGEMPLNFKAEKNGNYTLRFDTKDVEFDYLHLIDNLTGADVDLLTPPAGVPPLQRGQGGFNYTFTAKTTDYASRFRLVFSAGDADEDACEPPFAYISNGNIIINGTGTLQIIDILGKELVRKELSTLNSQLSTLNFAPGVYVLRLIDGNDVKTQKIVIDR